MRALLVQSCATSPWVPRRQWEPPSIGLASIAAQIDNHDVRIADMVVWRKRSAAELTKVLDSFRPQVIGFSAMTFQYASTVQFAHLARQRDPSILMVLGGYHASLFNQELGAGPEGGCWDYLIRGEGDFAFGELLDELEAGEREPRQVLGLSCRGQDGAFHHNPARPLEDLSRIKIPARHKRLVRGFHIYFWPADVIETSRGCLHKCKFCSINRLYGASFRPYALDRVTEDIENAYRHGARHLLLSDDNITLDMDRFEQLCDHIARMKLKGLTLATQASPIEFARRPDVVSKMVEAGFISVFLGIESVSKKSLRLMRKPNTVKLIRDGVAALRKNNIIVVAGIINGLPHDDEQSIRENYLFVRDLNVSDVMDQLLTPYPGTPLREDLDAEGLIENHDDFRWYDGFFANVRTRSLSAPELNFQRWRIRREILGMWTPTAADWEHFKGYPYVWSYGLKQAVWVVEKLLELILGPRGRYLLQMRHSMRLNVFDLPIPGAPRPSYNPVHGNDEDPHAESMAAMLLGHFRKALGRALPSREAASAREA